MANSKLKPCPFCGSEAEVEWFCPNEKPWKIRVCCKKCAGNIYERATTHFHDCINRYESEDEAEAAAIEEWNTRTERTCRPNPIYDRIFECDVCGEMDTDGVPNYCPGCGARVIHE